MKNKKRWREINRVNERLQAKRYGKRSYNRKGKKDSKKYKQERIRNKKMCKQYPWLIPRNVWTGEISWVKEPYDHTELDAMPDGWRKAFGEVWCEEMDKALRSEDYVQKFRIYQIKEKYGQLRVYHNNYADPIVYVTNAFEVISEHVCIRCGALDVCVIDDYGWYSPLCEKCYSKTSARISEEHRISYEKRLEDAGGDDNKKIPEKYTIHSWSKDEGDKYTEYDISNIVAKIRYKNRKRK